MMKHSKVEMSERSTNARSKEAVIIPLLLLGRFAKAWRKHQKLTRTLMAKRAGVDLHSIQQLRELAQN